MSLSRRLALLGTLLVASGNSLATDPQQVANRLIEQLQAGRFQQAETGFSDAMAKAVPAAALEQVWQSLGQQLGPLQQVGQATLTPMDAHHHRISQRLQFARGAVQASTVIDGEGRIAGFQLTPATAPAAVVPADASFSETALQVAAGPGPLGATLSLPKGPGPFPAVVLVHGSGPQDRDETVGPNKPFADLAHGLASAGIAVLRYDKRSQARPQDFADGASLALETTNDAIAAVALLKAQPGIDPDKVHVLGHSQGAMVASRIASASNAAGVVMLASPARPILDLLREQNVYLLAHSPGVDATAAQAHLQQLDAQIAALRSDPAAQLPQLPGLTGAYWQELEAVDVLGQTRASGLPTLLLQGGRDFQVIDTDWNLLTTGLQGERFTFHHYPALNHLGIAGEGPGTLAEYQQPGQVDTGLINDIAHWILAR